MARTFFSFFFVIGAWFFTLVVGLGLFYLVADLRNGPVLGGSLILSEAIFCILFILPPLIAFVGALKMGQHFGIGQGIGLGSVVPGAIAALVGIAFLCVPLLFILSRENDCALGTSFPIPHVRGCD